MQRAARFVGQAHGKTRDFILREYEGIEWDNTRYRVLSGGPCVCYLSCNVIGRDARIVLWRYPASTGVLWRVANVYVNWAEGNGYEPTAKYNVLQLNNAVPTALNQRINAALPSAAELYAMEGGCYRHWSHLSAIEAENPPAFMPDINLCSADTHIAYFGWELEGHIWTPKPQKNAIAGRRKMKQKRRLQAVPRN